MKKLAFAILFMIMGNGVCPAESAVDRDIETAFDVVDNLALDATISSGFRIGTQACVSGLYLSDFSNTNNVRVHRMVTYPRTFSWGSLIFTNPRLVERRGQKLMAAELKHVGVIQTHSGGCVYMKASTASELESARIAMAHTGTNYFAATYLEQGPRVDGCYEIFGTRSRANMARFWYGNSSGGFGCHAAENSGQRLSTEIPPIE